MPHSTSTRATALSLIAQYGEDAEVIAVLRAAELAALGDADGLAQWDEVIACIEEMQSAPPAGYQLN